MSLGQLIIGILVAIVFLERGRGVQIILLIRTHTVHKSLLLVDLKTAGVVFALA